MSNLKPNLKLLMTTIVMACLSAIVMACLLTLTAVTFAGPAATVANPHAAVVQTPDDDGDFDAFINPRAEQFENIRERLVQLGGVIACERDFSMMVIDYAAGAFYLIFVVDENTIARDGVRATGDITDAQLRAFAEDLCANGILSTYEQDVRSQLQAKPSG